MNKKLALTVLIVLAMLTLAACAPRTTSSALSPEEGDAYAVEVDEIVENMIVGDIECDFAMYTRDFDPEEWEGELEESAWQQKCEANQGVYGAYLSKTLDHVEDRGNVWVVIYHVVYENDPDVRLEVYFNPEDPDHLITGIMWQVE